MKMRLIPSLSILIFAVLALILLCEVANAQNANKRQRQRKKKPKPYNCHLKAIDTCLEKVELITNNRSSAALLKTATGIEKLCGVMLENIECNKNFTTRCATPLHKELYEFFVDGIIKSMNQFCNAGSIRSTFLQHSTCIHDKVLVNNEYRTKCVDNYLASVDKTNQLTNIDDRLDTGCCSYNRWEECSYTLVTKECGQEAKKSMQFFVERAFGGTANTLCNDVAFDFKSNKCRKLYAPSGSKPNSNSTNPITKYITSFMGFLF